MRVRVVGRALRERRVGRAVGGRKARKQRRFRKARALAHSYVRGMEQESVFEYSDPSRRRDSH
jgi:hypothetical protein